jgi:ligand-binding sensor domain-containing protein
MNMVNYSLLAFAPDGSMWAVQYDDTICRKKDNGWEKYYFPHEFFYHEFSYSISIAFDHQGRPWIAGGEDDNGHCQIAYFDEKQWTVESVPLPTLQNHCYIIDKMIFDSQDRLWLTFEDNGMRLAVHDNDSWISFDTADAVSGGRTDSVDSLYLDDEGLLWFSVGTSLVALDISGELPVTDPVPDSALTLWLVCYRLAWVFAFTSIALGIFTAIKSLSLE